MTTIRDIIVDACPRSELAGTLEAAREMAKAHGAKLLVASYAWPRSSLAEALLPNAQGQRVSMEAALQTSRRAFDTVFAGPPVDVEWCSGISDPASSLHTHALTADLLITDWSEEDKCVLPSAPQVAVETGIPVLRLGRRPTGGHFANVLVAWKDTSQARRAVHDALPLLAKADNVTIVGVGDEVFADRLEAVAAHLRRHDIKVQHRHIPAEGGNIASSLLAQAKRDGAELIVSGLYSRGFLTERVFGGVSTDLLKDASVSWFMAH